MRIGLVVLLAVLCLAGSAVVAEPLSIGFRVAEKPWDESLGSCRAVIHVENRSPTVRARIPWRRHDANPEAKAIIIVDATTNQRVRDFARAGIGREMGTVLFAPPTAPGDYYIYYLPYTPQPGFGNYDRDYVGKDDSNPAWTDKLATNQTLGEAQCHVIEYRTEFDRANPMEIIATAEETSNLLSQFSEREYFLFPEDRQFPIRMTDDLPFRWIEKGVTSTFAGSAKCNEFYCFQVGLWAPVKAVENVSVTFSPLRLANSTATISAKSIRCFNVGGIAPDGKPFAKALSVPQHKVQPLWFGIDIPSDATPGEYRGTVTIHPKNAKASSVEIALTVLPEVLRDRGDSEPWRYSRLRWLDSTLGIDDTVVAPYTPLLVRGQTISCLGRELTFGDDGLPEQILSSDNPILFAPMSFVVEGAAGPVKLGKAKARITSASAASVSWEAVTKVDQAAYSCQATMDFDGHVDYRITLRANGALAVSDIRLDILMNELAGTYLMGIGRKGGLLPAKNYHWKWTTPHDSFWIGDVHAGLHCEMRGASYSGPLLNLYHPAPPDSWSNGGLGGVTVGHGSDGSVLARMATGPRQLQKDQELHFDFSLMITPVKPLDTAAHFNQRYFHDSGHPAPTTQALAAGANVINVHHANSINPYINYPFIATRPMKDFVDEWHAKGLKVKIYYTIRELSNHVTEMWALRSLGNEILADGPGGGFPWLREHLIDHYTPAWYTAVSAESGPSVDAAILTAAGTTRWHNYYIEGLNWLIQNEGIDGLYLDDVAYDRTILKRMRRVMDHAKPGCLIDLHSNTLFSIGPANQYTEFFPYVDRLWFGEGFQYNQEDPAYWLTEVSGIPFGLMGEMLQDGGNKYRGMVYGMTTRLPWDGKSDPRPIWKLWDDFNIASAKMIGYWEKYCPVRTDNPEVLATVYKRQGQTLIAIASWAKAPADVKLQIDYRDLGISAANCTLTAPAIQGFQDAAVYHTTDSIHVQPLQGCILLLK